MIVAWDHHGTIHSHCSDVLSVNLNSNLCTYNVIKLYSTYSVLRLHLKRNSTTLYSNIFVTNKFTSDFETFDPIARVCMLQMKVGAANVFDLVADDCLYFVINIEILLNYLPILPAFVSNGY